MVGPISAVLVPSLLAEAMQSKLDLQPPPRLFTVVAFATITPFSSSQKEIAHWFGSRTELAAVVVAIAMAR